MHNRITELVTDNPHSAGSTPDPASPLHPLTQSPIHPSLLVRWFLDGTLTLIEICEYAEISLEQLEAWFDSDWTQTRLRIVHRLAPERDKAIRAEAVTQARQTLTHLAIIADPATVPRRQMDDDDDD